MWATAERFHGGHNVRKRLVNPADECIGGTKGHIDDCGPEHKLPCAAEIEAPLEDWRRLRCVPPTEISQAEIEQSEQQREGMIGRLSNPDGDFGMCDGLIELPEIGEYLGKRGLRKRRLDGRRPKALGTQVATERCVPLEQDNRIAKRAPGNVREAKKGGCKNLDRAIADGARDGEGLLPETG